MAEQNNPEDDIEQVAAGADDAQLDEEGQVIDCDPAALQVEIEELRQQLAEAKDQALRVAAEAQNQRRRAEKDVENAHKFALEKFIPALLPVADNLERTLDAADRNNEAVKPLLEGVELTYKGFLEVLAKFNVDQLNPLGEPFNPQLHEAVSIVDNPNAEPNTVVNVMQKGFTLNGRLLRAAMVVVTKGSAKKIDATA